MAPILNITLTTNLQQKLLLKNQHPTRKGWCKLWTAPKSPHVFCREQNHWWTACFGWTGWVFCPPIGNVQKRHWSNVPSTNENEEELMLVLWVVFWIHQSSAKNEKAASFPDVAEKDATRHKSRCVLLGTLAEHLKIRRFHNDDTGIPNSKINS